MKRLLIAFFLAWLVAFAAPAVADAQTTPPFAATANRTANLRAGPGTAYAIVGSVTAGQTVQVAECNTDCSWYILDSGNWIAAFLVAPVAPTTPVPAPVTDTPITLVAWNVESGGALQNVVADRLAAFDGVDIWGLSEVNAIDAEAFEFGAEEGEGADFDSLLGTTGAADRLLLIWDGERFEMIESDEMRAIGETGRAPLWVLLRERTTGLEFIVMVNHLHRSNAGIRHRQAQALNTWAAEQTLPVIALGDYNFDWNLPNGVSRDAGFDLMTTGGVWAWVRPEQLVTTQCTGWPCRYNSILDFVFVAGPARAWAAESQIVVVENDFPDDYTTPDHRPVLAVLSPNGTSVVIPTVTVIPTATPTTVPTATPVPTQSAGATANRTANLRSGPGTNYAIVGSMTAGQALQLTGRNQAGDWYKTASGAWIAASLVNNALGGLPVVADPPPTATPIPLPTDTRAGGGTVLTPDPPTPTLVPPTPTQAPPTPTSGNGCDPSYPDVCIPPYPPDLNCGDIPHRRFRVLPPDPHHFDGDKDGIGCESN